MITSDELVTYINDNKQTLGTLNVMLIKQYIDDIITHFNYHEMNITDVTIYHLLDTMMIYNNE